MTRRLKCRIDPEQSPYTCMLPEHKPVRRGREMIDLLAVEEPKPKPAKIRAVSYEAAIDQLFKRMRSSSSALTQQAVSTRRRPAGGGRAGLRGPRAAVARCRTGAAERLVHEAADGARAAAALGAAAETAIDLADRARPLRLDGGADI
jgi:hypothetical protein